MWTLTARWIFPVSGPPLERGTVAIDGERIVAVEPHGARPVDVDLGEAAVLPGLVNAHTHLDLSGLRGLAPPSPDFTAWLRQVIAFRRQRTPEQLRADIRAGLEECLRYGTTLLGDISGDGSSWDVLADARVRALMAGEWDVQALLAGEWEGPETPGPREAPADAPLRAFVFRELLGLPAPRAEAARDQILNWLVAHPRTDACRVGVSPHAPYSVRAWLIQDMIYHAVWPVAVHLAETAEELELLEHQRGPFVPFLQELGVWDPSGLARSADHVLRMARNAALRRTPAALGAPPYGNTLAPVLFVHGNYLDPASLFPPHGSLVYCPRTHAAFGHPPHPFREFLARGVRVAVGTDSLASNPDLDVLAEIRFLHRHYPDMPGAPLLRMATLSGAEALGWQDQTGSLSAGKSADLVAVPLASGQAADPHEALLRGGEPVRDVLFRGRWVRGPLSGS
jgi:cytosine/adenosine deaminase-related metal-dependent hydrolase